MVVEIRLRIVGIFFNKILSVDFSKYRNRPTIFDVMNEYRLNNPITSKGGLDFTMQTSEKPGRKMSMLSISHNYPGRYDFDGDGDLTNDAPNGETLGNEVRAPGEYTLMEIAGDDVYVGWQYYVLNKDYENVSATSAAGDFTPFTDYVLSNDTKEIIWRMVAIRRRPSKSALIA